jgi:hypothetical protein
MIQGKRRDNPDDLIPEPGEYGKGSDGKWFGCPPQPLDDDGFPLVANLSKHQVEEHPDGTITVSPSILITKPHADRLWHGFLERGIWREV